MPGYVIFVVRHEETTEKMVFKRGELVYDSYLLNKGNKELFIVLNVSSKQHGFSYFETIGKPFYTLYSYKRKGIFSSAEIVSVNTLDK